jgi:BirA family biotin operon repressor/biotin-[acetyl-CoA-carboxylase] ligase
VPERLDVVDSTNRYLVDLALAGRADGSEVPEGHAVVAERQSEGRGRLQRRWEAPPGTAVLCSILLRPDLEPGDLHLTAWVVALAALQTCREIAGVELSLKWPNDLLARAGGLEDDIPSLRECPDADQKVAGILSEIVPQSTSEVLGGRARRRPAGVVVGIGINVNWPADWPPPGSKDPEMAAIAARATSLNRITGQEIDRGALLTRLLLCVGRWNLLLASEEGRRELASRYRLSCSTIGKMVRVELQEETVVGRALDLDDAGCLLVATASCIRTVSAGDVIHLR